MDKSDNFIKLIQREIFDKIDKLILKNLSEKPVPIKDSKFFKEYKKMKEEYGLV